MTSENWRRVWHLCEQARQIPRDAQARFVYTNAGDPDIAREVLSLLAEPDHSVVPSWNPSSSSGGFVGTAVRSARTLAGIRVGRYAVGELIGSGAGGDVYAARDVDLERPVAMKFLRHGTAESEWRVEW